MQNPEVIQESELPVPRKESEVKAIGESPPSVTEGSDTDVPENRIPEESQEAPASAEKTLSSDIPEDVKETDRPSVSLEKTARVSKRAVEAPARTVETSAPEAAEAPARTAETSAPEAAEAPARTAETSAPELAKGAGQSGPDVKEIPESPEKSVDRTSSEQRPVTREKQHPGFKQGGRLQEEPSGSDTMIGVNLTPGEYVLPVSIVQSVGTRKLEQLRSGQAEIVKTGVNEAAESATSAEGSTGQAGMAQGGLVSDEKKQKKIALKQAQQQEKQRKSKLRTREGAMEEVGRTTEQLQEVNRAGQAAEQEWSGLFEEAGKAAPESPERKMVEAQTQSVALRNQADKATKPEEKQGLVKQAEEQEAAVSSIVETARKAPADPKSQPVLKLVEAQEKVNQLDQNKKTARAEQQEAVTATRKEDTPSRVTVEKEQKARQDLEKQAQGQISYKDRDIRDDAMRQKFGSPERDAAIKHAEKVISNPKATKEQKESARTLEAGIKLQETQHMESEAVPEATKKVIQKSQEARSQRSAGSVKAVGHGEVEERQTNREFVQRASSALGLGSSSSAASDTRISEVARMLAVMKPQIDFIYTEIIKSSST